MFYLSGKQFKFDILVDLEEDKAILMVNVLVSAQLGCIFKRVHTSMVSSSLCVCTMCVVLSALTGLTALTIG